MVERRKRVPERCEQGEVEDEEEEKNNLEEGSTSMTILLSNDYFYLCLGIKHLCGGQEKLLRVVSFSFH